MAQYYFPNDITNGTFISVNYWNRLFGANGSLQFLKEQYSTKTGGYHLKIIKNNIENMSASWIMTDTTVNNIISFDDVTIDFYPEYSSSIWDGLDGRPNQVTILESGYYFLHLHLEIFNYNNQAGYPCYAHIIKTAGENFEQTSIASNYIFYPYSQTSNLAQVKWDNQLSVNAIDVSTIIYLNSNDTITCKIQPYITSSGNTTLSFVSRDYTYVPTAYYSNGNRGETSFITQGTQTSFINSGYLGMNGSFFEIISLKLE